MPYVEVWVDDPSCICDGNCESAKKLSRIEDMVDAARIAILECRWDDADKILRGEKFVEPRAPISSIRAAYEIWKKGALKGFAGAGQP